MTVTLTFLSLWGIAEVYLRLHVAPSTFLVYHAYAERSSFVPAPHWHGSHYAVPFTIEAHGYRAMPCAAPDTDPAIVFIGDSFVFGSGVKDDETIPACLSKHLKGRRYRVINAAFPGYGPYNYQCRFQEIVAKEPNIRYAFVGVFAGNDFADVYDERTQREPLTFARTAEIFLLNNVKVYSWLRQWRSRRNTTTSSVQEERLSRMRAILRGDSDFAKQCIADGLAELAIIQQVADARRIAVRFFSIPIPQQLTREANENGLYCRDVWPPDPVLLENIPGKMFLEFCSQHNMSAMDMSDAFRAAPMPLTHFPGDSTNKTVLMPVGTVHLSPEGCELVARVLWDWAFGDTGSTASSQAESLGGGNEAANLQR